MGNGLAGAFTPSMHFPDVVSLRLLLFAWDVHALHVAIEEMSLMATMFMVDHVGCVSQSFGGIVCHRLVVDREVFSACLAGSAVGPTSGFLHLLPPSGKNIAKVSGFGKFSALEALLFFFGLVTIPPLNQITWDGSSIG